MAEAKQSCIVFASGLRTYALPSALASEIVTYEALTALPAAPAHLKGLLPHRGEVIPVVDLGVLAGGAPIQTQRAIVVRVKGGAFALTATSVIGVTDLEGHKRRLGDFGFAALLSGPYSHQGLDVALIDPDGLFELLSQSGSSTT